jgi:hypothetical protein
VSSHDRISEESHEKKGYHETEDNPRELLYHEQYASKNWYNEHQKIRDDIFPGNLFLVELVWITMEKKESSTSLYQRHMFFRNNNSQHNACPAACIQAEE